MYQINQNFMRNEFRISREEKTPGFTKFRVLEAEVWSSKKVRNSIKTCSTRIKDVQLEKKSYKTRRQCKNWKIRLIIKKICNTWKEAWWKYCYVLFRCAKQLEIFCFVHKYIFKFFRCLWTIWRKWQSYYRMGK